MLGDPEEGGSPHVWVCGDCFNGADDTIEAAHAAAKRCGVVVKRAFAVVDEPNAYTEERDSQKEHPGGGGALSMADSAASAIRRRR